MYIYGKMLMEHMNMYLQLVEVELKQDLAKVLVIVE